MKYLLYTAAGIFFVALLLRIENLERQVEALTKPKLENVWDSASITLLNRIQKLEAKVDSMKRPIKHKPQGAPKRVKLDSTGTARIERIVFSELLSRGVDSTMAKIIVAIAKHESAGFNSKLYQTSYNLFGMTYPPKRPTTAVGHIQFLDNGNVRRFCKFNSTSSSAADMVLYLKHRGYPLNIKSPEEMVRLMKSKRYFEAPEKLYLKAVKRHLSLLTI